MKKILLSCAISMFSLVSIAGINSKYDEGYSLDPSSVNTADKEYAIAPYKEHKIIFVKDSKVYVTKLDTATGDLETPVLSPDFKNLSIDGLVAYDLKRHRIYYSKFDEKYGADYLYQSTADTAGVWMPGKRMRIRGTVKSRTKQGFMKSAGWNYRLPYVGGFYNPTFSDNKDRLYFSTTMEGVKGGRDIYYTDIENEEELIWGFPQSVGNAVNSEKEDDWAYVEGDSLMYFSSSKNGKMEVYQAESVDSVWTNVVSLGTPYNDGEANYNLFVQEGTPMLISQREGSQGEDIFLFQLVPEPEPEPLPEIERKKRFHWEFLLFDFNKANLDEAFQRKLENLVVAMKEFPGSQFEISGYTDSRGSEAYNDQLSQRRADQIRDMLLEKGFLKEELVSVGFGERRPHVPNAQTEEEHAKNRIVEVRIIIDESENTPAVKKEIPAPVVTKNEAETSDDFSDEDFEDAAEDNSQEEDTYDDDDDDDDYDDDFDEEDFDDDDDEFETDEY